MATETERDRYILSAATLQMFDRSVIGENERGVTYDWLRRKHFRKMGPSLVLEAVPALVEHLAPVPDDFWTLEVGEDGHSVAQVACPCRNVHEIKIGHLREAECGRFFYALGTTLLVANSPAPQG